MSAGRGAAHEGGNGVLGSNVEYAFQDEQVEIFMAQGEAEVIAEAIARPVPFVVDRPLARLPEARLDVLVGDRARATDRRTHAEALNQPGPARQPCLGGHRLFLEGSGAIISDDLILGRHGRESFFSVENHSVLGLLVENKYSRPSVEKRSFWSKIAIIQPCKSKTDLRAKF